MQSDLRRGIGLLCIKAPQVIGDLHPDAMPLPQYIGGRHQVDIQPGGLSAPKGPDVPGPGGMPGQTQEIVRRFRRFPVGGPEMPLRHQEGGAFRIHVREADEEIRIRPVGGDPQRGQGVTRDPQVRLQRRGGIHQRFGVQVGGVPALHPGGDIVSGGVVVPVPLRLGSPKAESSSLPEEQGTVFRLRQGPAVIKRPVLSLRHKLGLQPDGRLLHDPVEHVLQPIVEETQLLGGHVHPRLPAVIPGAHDQLFRYGEIPV